MKNSILILIFFLNLFSASAQLTVPKEHFTRRDSLQGGLRPERTSFDVLRYDLNIKISPNQKSIVGYNDITFKTTDNTSKIQIDLFENMNVDSIIFNGKKLDYKREEIATFINFPSALQKNSENKIRFYYSGNPVIAKKAPWDGGFVFSKDEAGKPWIGVACQGFGASCWFPVKDSQSDEPDFGATIKVAVPNGLMNVSNGRFLGMENLQNGYTRWDWEVKNPINTYDITVNIADYVHINDTHKGLDLDYYVLRANEAKARKHFEEVKPMMDCFQSKFGKYPFSDDGYKLVETPYLGMEHQSAVAYGNHYMKGYMGNDLSGTGVGLLFDYITIHESGHEWFGNSITSKDIADMWIHEGFTMYSEIVFIECQFGYDKAMQYAYGLRNAVSNDRPIIGHYGVNKEGSGDMYPKGALMLNTIRHIVNNDSKWWKMLLKYSETFKKQIIKTQDVVDFFNKESGLDLTPVFNQYLRYTTIPELEFRKSGKVIEYKWKAEAPNFSMPIDVMIKGKKIRLEASSFWKVLSENVKSISDIQPIKTDFYIKY
ncbi:MULTISPECIES: M1 family metallopeptidase [Flavobacterium]|uniref:M1 family metallopeptidase n=1 Tax=Flavobacterium hankyongi TaxID=1176532 RepID=A0ABP9A4K7_9FLAO|nr:M1 family metallopeptidase [Flavobacterium sp. N1846]